MQSGDRDTHLETSGLAEVLASAAALRRLVPDAVLVGGTAAARYAGHRLSLRSRSRAERPAQRYAQVLEAVEVSDGWVTDVRASSPPLALLGSLDGIEAGLRQLRRTRPLEVQTRELPGGACVRVPTLPEMLRVKAYLVVQRNNVRDYLDTVALAAQTGEGAACEVLSDIDDYYLDRSGERESVLTALVTRLSDPAPRDVRVARQLVAYKGLDARWHRWERVVSACQELADGIVELLEARTR